MQLYLLRHAQSQANVEDKLSSSLPGAPLSAQGETDIEHLAKSPELDTIRIHTAYVSPFLRTQQTYAILRQHRTDWPDATIVHDIRELDYGEFDGRSIAEIRYELLAARERALNGETDTQFGPKGETDYIFKQRVWKFLLHCLSYHQHETVLFVSHASPISLIRYLLAEIDPAYPKTGSTLNSTFYHFRLDDAHAHAIQEALAQLERRHRYALSTQ
jgi:probable phosphoglycerate mutase